MTICIDAHQHFWDPALADYPWMQGDAMAPIRRTFGPTDLAPLLAANAIDASIVVQCRASLDETEGFLRLANATPFVIGVGGWADQTDPALGDTIARLRDLPGGNRLVGIRHQVHDEEDPDWLSLDEVLRGLDIVAAHDLSYDFLVRTRELPAANVSARQVPHGRFVLDHAAKPPIATGFDQQWADRIAELASNKNVWCKISGLATEAAWNDWDAERLFPSVAHAARCFGEDRLMIGSDWPVCLLAGSYDRIRQAQEQCLARLGPAFRDKASGPNAVTAYRLAL
jgi:L-fuconolactonase